MDLDRDNIMMWLLLIGGAVAVYFLTRPSAPGTGVNDLTTATPQPGIVYAPGNMTSAQLLAAFNAGRVSQLEHLRRMVPTSQVGNPQPPVSGQVVSNDPAVETTTVNGVMPWQW